MFGEASGSDRSPPVRPPTPEQIRTLREALHISQHVSTRRPPSRPPPPCHSNRRSSSSDPLCSPSHTNRSSHNEENNLMQFDDPEEIQRQRKITEVKMLSESINTPVLRSPLMFPNPALNGNLSATVNIPHMPYTLRHTDTAPGNFNDLLNNSCNSSHMLNSTDIENVQNHNIRNVKPSCLALPSPFRLSVMAPALQNGDLIDLGPNFGRTDQILSPEEAQREFDPLVTELVQNRINEEKEEKENRILRRSLNRGANLRPNGDNLVQNFDESISLRRNEDRNRQMGQNRETVSLTVPSVRSFVNRTPSNSKIDREKGKILHCLDDLQLVPNTSNIEQEFCSLRDQLYIKENVLNDASRIDGRQWTSCLLAPIVDYPLTSVQLKIVVKCDEKKVTLITDTHSLVQDVLSEALVNFESDTNSMEFDNACLKIQNHDEYLLPSTCIGNYAYVYRCLTLAQDPIFVVDTKPNLVTHEQGSVSSVQYVSDWFKTLPIQPVLDTVKREMAKIKTSIENAEPVKSQGLEQALKAFCTSINQTLTIDLIRAIDHLIVVIDKVSEDRNIQKSLTNSPKSPSPICDRLPKIDQCESALTLAMHKTLTLLCSSAQADIKPAPLIASNEARNSTTNMEKGLDAINERFMFRLESMHHLHPTWSSIYDAIHVEAYLLHGWTMLSSNTVTARSDIRQHFFHYVHFDHWLPFDIPLCILPREARLAFRIFGFKIQPSLNDTNMGNESDDSSFTPLGWCSMPLFDRNWHLRDGSFLLPVESGTEVEPFGPMPVMTHANAPSLLISLPRFGNPVVFPDVVCQIPFSDRSSRDFDCLDEESQHLLKDIIENRLPEELTSDERNLLWDKRMYIRLFTEALPLVLQSALGWDWACLSNIYVLLHEWAPLNLSLAMSLLAPGFPDLTVRGKAVEWLEKCSVDQIMHFVTQLVEALRYECMENSELARMLIEHAKGNRRFAYELYWSLEQRLHLSGYFGLRCKNLQSELLYQIGATFARELKHQCHVLKALDNMATDVKRRETKSEKTKMIAHHARELHFYLVENPTRMPVYPGYIANGVVVEKCSYFNSLTQPLKIIFSSTAGEQYGVLYKVGDDLRQDHMVLQLVKIMNDIWLSSSLDLRMIIFPLLVTGVNKGMIELVPECQTLREIQVEFGWTNILKDVPIQKWLQKQNANEFDYKKSVETFRLSCAGWCVATYVLGIGDRHNDNILLTRQGHVFHIDFGKYLGDSETVAGVSRDRVPFVLTSDMMYVINEGSVTPTVHFHDFVDTCCKAFNELRVKFNMFISLIQLMQYSGIKGLNKAAIDFVRGNLWLECCEAEATARFSRLIVESLSSLFPKLNFLAHTFAQWKTGTKTEDDPGKLSYVKDLHTMREDGRIILVQIMSCEKWKGIEHDGKNYMYKIRVERVHDNVPTHIYRSFKEFSEFYQKLRLRYPLAYLPTFSKGHIGRTNVRDVAERRKVEIQLFLSNLFKQDGELSHCDLVYTFFHTLLRDQMEKNELEIPATPHQLGGTLQVNISYQRGALHVLICHARNLPNISAGNAPDAYIKCYLKPDPLRKTKKKTRVVKNTVNPTFMETLTYPLPLENLIVRSLEVCAWHYDRMKENIFLGGCILDLSLLVPSKIHKLSGWHKLGYIPRSL